MTSARGPLAALLLALCLITCGDDSSVSATDGASDSDDSSDSGDSGCDESFMESCVDDDQITYCLDGHVEIDSCQRFCSAGGLAGVTYEYGECDTAESACYCCNAGDGGCPAGA